MKRLSGFEGLRRGWGLFGMALLLTACAGAPSRQADPQSMAAQMAREQQLHAWSAWGFTGRIAVSGEGESGSGRIDWRREGESLEVSLQAPVSRQSWRLRAGVGFARLEGLEGGPREAPDAESLLREALGWQLPLRAVEAWVRGARDHSRARLQFGSDGLPQEMREAGWVISYRGWLNGEPRLPRRVFAESNRQRLRLVVDAWQVPGD